MLKMSAFAFVYSAFTNIEELERNVGGCVSRRLVFIYASVLFPSESGQITKTDTFLPGHRKD
jgi:hypothetical protein